MVNVSTRPRANNQNKNRPRSSGLLQDLINNHDGTTLQNAAMCPVNRHMRRLVEEPDPLPFVEHLREVVRRVKEFLRASLRIA
jgi:hypothetical protein